MNNTPPLFPRPISASGLPAATNANAKMLLDYGTEDGMSTDRASANKLPAEQQLTRFLQWLRYTDRGTQPC